MSRNRFPGYCGLLLLLCLALWGQCFALSDEPPAKRFGDVIKTEESLYRFTFSPTGDLLAVAGGRFDPGADREPIGELTLWDVKTQKRVRSLAGHTDLIMSVAFSPDGKVLASGGCDKTVRLWDTRTGKELAILKDATDWIMGLAFSPDGKTLAGIVMADTKGTTDYSTPGVILLWDVATRKVRAELKGDAGPVRAIAFSPDGKTLAGVSGKWDPMKDTFTHGVIELWDPVTGKLIDTLKSPGWDIWSMAYSPDGKTLVIARSVTKDEDRDPLTIEYHGEVQFWDTKSKQIRGTVEFTGEPTKLAFRPDGRLLAVQTWGGKGVLLLDPSTRKVVGNLPKPEWDNASEVAFSPVGRLLATPVDDNTLQLWQFPE